jgi:nitrate/TMAO reductase-like tetraheme cytochrome c subunit
VPDPTRLHAPALLLLAPLLLGPAPGRAADPVGPETCKACHPVAYELWRQGPHARAQAALPERSRTDARCTGCHAPEASRAQAGVGCEACHGNGQLYAHRYVMRDRELARLLGLQEVGEKTCARCHDEAAPGLSRWDYARKLPLIQHGEADREARRAAAAGR